MVSIFTQTLLYLIVHSLLVVFLLPFASAYKLCVYFCSPLRAAFTRCLLEAVTIVIIEK